MHQPNVISSLFSGKLTSYGDDTVILFIDNSWDVVLKNIELELNVKKWLSNSLFSLSAEK